MVFAFEEVIFVREKKRYLRVLVESGEKLDAQGAKKLLIQAVLETLGELGVAQAAFSFKAFDERKQEAVVKCSTASLDKVVASLALKRFFDGRDVALRVVKVEGCFSPKTRGHYSETGK